MAVKREYMVLGMVTAFMVAACGLAMWGGLFTNAKLQIKEATCANLQESVVQSFNSAPASPWKPSATMQIRQILDSSEATPVKAANGDVVERRCRGSAVMTDGSHAKLSYKLYESEGKAVRLVGIGNEGEMRVFRRD